MEKRPCFWKTTADPEKGPLGLKHICFREDSPNEQLCIFFAMLRVLFCHSTLRQCSKPFTPSRLWFKILIRKHFKNDVVAHLGCSLSSPTPRCVRRPACAVANKALDFDKKGVNRVMKDGCDPFFVGLFLLSMLWLSYAGVSFVVESLFGCVCLALFEQLDPSIGQQTQIP